MEIANIAIPRYAAFQSKNNSKYLRFIDEDVQIHSYVQYSGDNVISTFTKFGLEPANSGRNLFHIRSSYNNKYWVTRSQYSNWIIADAGEPNEDQSKWDCTLFQPVYDSTHGAYRFRHVKTGYNALIWSSGLQIRNCLFLNPSSAADSQLRDLHVVIDWESLLVLPKHIVFKGDNGKYLGGLWQERRPYLQFLSDDIGDSNVGQEVFTTSDGSVRIKSKRFDKFWRNGGNWIWADSDDMTSNDKGTLFWPVRASNNVVALRNLGNNLFCMRISKEHKWDVLNADSRTISNPARLEIEESVLSREIFNVDFRVLDGRVYGHNILTVANGSAVNDHTEESVVDIKLTYTKETTNTWESSVSMKLGVETTIRTGVPLLVSGEITVNTEFSGSYTWGETRSTTETVETTYTVKVPPRSRVRVSVLASRASIDVPFSYTQRDTLINGEQVNTRLDDGVFTGANAYDFKYETRSEPL